MRLSYLPSVCASICLISSLFSMQAMAQSGWQRISPLEYCERFEIEYKVTSDGEYKVRIPSPSGPKELDQKLEDINDLSSLTDILVDESVKVCSGETELRVEGNSIVYQESAGVQTRECSTALVYSEPYLDLTRQMVEILQYSGNRCDQLMAYTKLQTKITQLSDEDLIKLERPSNLGHMFIKLFAGDDTDEMINLYTTCGGDDFSDKFVANIIMIEAKNSCVMPKPPGMFTFEEAKAIAEDVAKDYNGLGIMGINSKKDEITKKAMLALSLQGVKSEVSNLLGEQLQDVDSFVSDLDAVKEIKNADFGDLDPDYLGLGFTFDVTMEIAQKAVPIMAEASFGDKLPPTWSQERRENYINDEFLPKIKQDYAACMQEHFDGTGFGQNLSIGERLSKRKDLKRAYCDNYPEQCQGKSCKESINILSQNPEIADAQVAQGCVMQALIGAVKPTIKLSILQQAPNFEKDFTLTEEVIDGLTDDTYNTLLQCANRQVLQAQGASVEEYEDLSKPPLLTEPEYLQKVSAAEFEDIILECANVAEIDVAKEFFVRTLMSQEALAEALGGSDENASSQASLKREVDAILRETYDPCIMKQHYRSFSTSESNPANRNPMLCVPAVEIAAAASVIDGTLKDLYAQNGMGGNPEALLASKEFENCADAAAENAINSVGAQTDDVATPITTDDDATAYLSNNHEFYGCVKDAIVGATGIVGGKLFDETTGEMASQLSDPSYLAGLKNGALNETAKCFENKLNDIPDWKAFMEYNDQGGLDRLQAECSAVAVDYVLPKTLIRETGGQMAVLRDEGFLNGSTEVGNVLAEAAFQLRRKYNLDLPSSLRGDDIVEWSFAQAHNAHLRTNGNDTNSFVTEYTGVVMNSALGAVHQNIAKRVDEFAQEDYSDFFEALSPQCLHRAYKQFEGPLNEMIESMSKEGPARDPGSNAPMVDEIATMMLTGLKYQKGLGARAYREKIDDISRVCSNISSYDDPMDLAETGAFDFLLKGVIQDTLFDSFDKVVTDQCFADLEPLARTAGAREALNKACNSRSSGRYNPDFGRFKRFFAAGSDELRTIAFAEKRHREMVELLDNKLKDSRELERTVFSGRPSVMDAIYADFTDIVSEDKESMQELSTVIAGKLFRDKSTGSFANEFVKTQVVNGLGISGYQQARAAITIDVIDENINWLTDVFVSKTKAQRVGREGLAQAWNPEQIEEWIAWDDINQSQRNRLIASVYDNAVAPAINGTEDKSDRITEVIGSHASNYKYSSDQQTFEERVSSLVVSYIKDNKSDIIGIGN